jgi:hypothetical protein
MQPFWLRERRVKIMARTIAHPGTIIEHAHAGDYSYQAYQILHWGFVVAPLLAGIDKFFHLLNNWDMYLSSQFASIGAAVGLGAHSFMLVVGVIEIVAGLIVAVKPRFGAYIVAAWLVGIIVNLLLLGQFYDIALRDFGLFLAALALGRLSERFDVAETAS